MADKVRIGERNEISESASIQGEVGHDNYIGQDVIIEENVVIGDGNFITDNVKLETASMLLDARASSNTYASYVNMLDIKSKDSSKRWFSGVQDLIIAIYNKPAQLPEDFPVKNIEHGTIIIRTNRVRNQKLFS